MKHFLNTKRSPAYVFCISALLIITSCSKKTDAVPVPPKLTVTTLASGFASPNGIATDAAGNVWVSDQGTGANDAKVWVIKPTGEKFAAIINFESIVVGTD